MAYKLLLADDSVTIQRVIELTFADEDIQVTAVGDGQQAIDRIQAEPPDIVLADVGMPQRDGFAVASFIKQTPQLSHIPVILLTGAFEPVDPERVRAVGCDGVLAKPFEPQLLIQKVKELLATPPGARQAIDPSAPTFEDEPMHVPDTPVGLDGVAVAPGGAVDPRASVDEYFDRLDAAFATVTGVPANPPAAVVPAAVATPSAAQSVAPIPRPPATPAAAVGGVSPEIAAAFDWLLAAEQGQPVPPNLLPAQRQAHAVALDKIVDEITQRVVERVADQGVRDQVADIVSKVAERLVRDEIARLKAGLK